MCRCLFCAKFPVKFAPPKCFYGTLLPFAFHAEPFLATYHQQLVIVLVAKIRLLWILEVSIQLRKHRHRRRFHPHWIFPHPAESWFKILLLDCEQSLFFSFRSLLEIKEFFPYALEITKTCDP